MAAVKELQRDLENKANDLNKLPLSFELDLLNVDANVFKLIGTVLVKQDLAEANANVRKRIDYISAELKRSDATLPDLEEKENSNKDAIFKSQQRIQSLQAGKGQGIIGPSQQA